MKTLKLKVIITAVSLAAAGIAGYTMAWFTDTAPVSEAKFTAGTVQIAADRTLDGPSGMLYYETVPYTVASYNQANVTDSERILTGDVEQFILPRITERTAPGAKPDVDDFYTLGRTSSNSTSYLELQLARPLEVNEKVRVIECSWGKPNPEEKANVYVSEDGSVWEWIDEISSKDEGPNVTNQHTSTIVIPETIETVKYIKFEDNTRSSSSDGYDIDYLGVVLMDVGNWNPGDVNYIAYKVDNVGTKDSVVRAIIDGHWVDNTLPGTNVSIEIAENSNWTQSGNVFTYSGILAGTSPEFGSNPTSAYLYLKVTLDGPGTGNAYQGETFVLTPTFQAVQASHSSDLDGTEGWSWTGVFPPTT